MPHVCPRPCSRLATAAVFISVGVIQFIVGIILLKSKYVYLLSFPDFWTSLSNMSVGCLLGLSASVWKDSRKKRATKYIVRRNLLTALMLTALTMNTTTAGILILGEGNTLLSIQLENSGKPNSASLAGEILAYAYATSVCSPIVCIVVAIVFISGNCFQNSTPKEPKTPRTPEKALQKELPYYEWVYSPDLLKLHKYSPKNASSASSSSSESSLSSADELFKEPMPLSDIALYKKHVDPRTQGILYKLVPAGGNKGEVNDGKTSKQFLPAPCMHAECSIARVGSYEGPTRPRQENLCVYEKVPMKDGASSSKIAHRKRSRSFNRQQLESKLSGLSTSSDEVFKDIVCRNSRMVKYFKDNEIHRKRPNSSIETSNEYQNICMKQYANSQFDELHQLQRSRRSYPGMAMRSSQGELYQTEAVVHEDNDQFPNLIAAGGEFLPLQDLSSTKVPGKVTSSVTFEDKQSLHQDSCDSDRIFKPDIYAQRQKELFSDESETGADSSFDMSKSSPLVGRLVPIQLHSSTKKSPKLIPVPSPRAPIPGENCNTNGYLAPECENEERGESVQNKLGNRDSNLSSFKDSSKNLNKEKMPETVSGTSKNQHAKKLDLVSRTSSMEPISEIPTEEANVDVHMDSSVPYSSYTSSPEGNYNINVSSEAEEIAKEISVEEAPAASTPVSENVSSNNSKCFENSRSKRESSSMKLDRTPQNSNILRKLWSSVGSDVKLEFLDQIVDGDSLIGLSEKDLIARQLRTRSLRKTVQQRLKQVEEE